MTLHGNDLFHPRSNRHHARRAAVHGAARGGLARVQREHPGAGTTRARRGAARRHRPRPLPPDPAREARERLGLDPDGAVPAVPRTTRPAAQALRPRARGGRRRAAAARSGRVAPDEVPYWINAANAVLVPSQAEGFGLSVIEALACGVPVFGTPVGIHPVALGGHRRARSARRTTARRGGPRCARTSTAADPRVDGRARAELFSADRMAARVVAAWREVAALAALGGDGTATYTRTSGRIPTTRPAAHERPVATPDTQTRRDRRRDPARERRRPPSRSTPPSSPTRKVPPCPRRSGRARRSSGAAAATCPPGSTPTASRRPSATMPAAAPCAAGSAS